MASPRAEFIGHTALIYSVASSSSGLVATGSEDNTLKARRSIMRIRSDRCIGNRT